MGKYLKKPKLTGEVVEVMDSSLGVRTRAKTLALQKLEASTTQQQNEFLYLQLRSRKLEKPPLQKSSSFYIQQNPNPLHCDFGSEEASYGENNVEFDGRERGTRESTPCSFIRDSNDNITPGSSTRPANPYASNQVMQTSMQRIMPSAQEIKEFFALHAQEQQRLFSEKYNFDIVDEKPIEGRYEWVKVQL